MHCIKSVKIFIVAVISSFALLQQLIFVFTKYIYMMLTLLKRSFNSFNTLNEHIFIYNRQKVIAKKKKLLVQLLSSTRLLLTRFIVNYCSEWQDHHIYIIYISFIIAVSMSSQIDDDHVINDIFSISTNFR